MTFDGPKLALSLIALAVSLLFTVDLFQTPQLSQRTFLAYCAVSIVSLGGWGLTKQTNTKGQFSLAALMVIFLFPLGACLSAILLVWRSLRPPPLEGSGELGNDDISLFVVRKKISSPTDRSIDEEVFLPAVSLLQSDDINERRAAIDVLAQIGGPEQIRHLQSCLDDPEREVYQYAHAKLTGLHERHTDSIKSAQAAGVLEKLLDCYMDYLVSGLLGDATLAFYRQKALATAEQLLDRSPKSVPLLTLLGDLYLDQELIDDAKDVLQQALQCEADSLEAHWGLAQIAYREQDFESLQEHLAQLRKLVAGRTAVRSEVLEAITWWVQTGDEPQAEVPSLD